MLSYISQNSSEGDTEWAVLRDRDVVFAMLVRCEAKVAAGLSSDLVSERPQHADEILTTDITGKPHTAITSSRTK